MKNEIYNEMMNDEAWYQFAEERIDNGFESAEMICDRMIDVSDWAGNGMSPDEVEQAEQAAWDISSIVWDNYISVEQVEAHNGMFDSIVDSQEWKDDAESMVDIKFYDVEPMIEFMYNRVIKRWERYGMSKAQIQGGYNGIEEICHRAFKYPYSE